MRSWLELLLLMLLGTSVSFAAPCLNGHPTSREEYKQRPYVLTAKVLSSTAVRDSKDGWFYGGTNYKVEPLQKFKGNIPEPLVVFSENSSGRFPMEVGKTYLLFLYEENGRLLVDSCGTSGLVESLRSNVEDVRSLAEHSDIATKHEKRSGSPFRSMVRPLGWELPKRGAPKSRRLLDPDRGLMRLGSHIYVTELGSSEPMLLPWYYIENERLMLYSFEFRIPDLLLYDYDKKPFRYVAQAVGSHVGASAIATWTDRDGDGVFEEFRWASSPIEDLPNWVSVEGDIESSVIH